jgi:hypothetical protein
VVFDKIVRPVVRVAAGALPRSPVPPPSPSPSPSGVDACRPPVRGVVPRLVCGGGGPARWPGAVTDWLSHAWPALAVAAGLVAVLAGLVWSASRRRRVAEARAGRWLEVVPPPVAVVAGGGEFWRLVATVQRRVAGRAGWDRRRAVVGLEVLARRGRLRVGLWLPAGVPVAEVRHAVTVAWPGAQLRPGPVPAPPAGGRLAVRWARPAGGEALPVVDPARQHARRDPGAEDDPLHGVFAGVMGAAAAGQWAMVQILTRPAGGRRLRAARAQTRPGTRRVSGLRRVVLDLLDLLTPGPSTPVGGQPAGGWADPLAADRARAVAVKAAAGPHWEVAVTVAVAAADRPAAVQWADQIGSGLALLSDPTGLAGMTGLSCRRRRMGAGRLAARLPRASGWWLACLPELAALAHLPYAPAKAGVQATAGRQVPPPPQMYLTDDNDNEGGRWFDVDAA